jgi:uncharacterized DUF497 family protein
MEFEWDPKKDHMNQEMHGLSFTEASSVFGDPLHRTVGDPRHSFGVSVARQLVRFFKQVNCPVGVDVGISR